MTISKKIESFLSSYDEEVFARAIKLREILLAKLPEINEQLDTPAKMIAYSYGSKYADLICVIIPSKKGLKLGFNRGTELSDPDHLLEGTGKISRYIQIRSDQQIRSKSLKRLLGSASKLYQQKLLKKK